jgi:hypothetical protein
MATSFTGWILDQARNEYYYFSKEEQAYIYQSGEKIYLPDGSCVLPLSRSPSILTRLAAIRHAPSFPMMYPASPTPWARWPSAVSSGLPYLTTR